jgi:hypothetical protein
MDGENNQKILSRSDFHALVQNRLAQIAVGASTARNMGPKGTVDGAREFLAALPIDEFSTTSEALFKLALDQRTAELQCALPREFERGGRWGVARKFLNLFLRDAFYTTYTRERFRLKQIEGFLEVPLDSHVANWLRRRNSALPRWVSVVSLTPEQNSIFQEYAAELARGTGKARVHLDLQAWRNDEIVRKRIGSRRATRRARSIAAPSTR